MTDHERAQQLIEQVKKFIEYARYELQPGEPMVGSLFPHQADADRAIAKLNEVVGLLAAPTLRAQIEALPRWGQDELSDNPETVRQVRYGRFLRRDAVLALLPAPEKETR